MPVAIAEQTIHTLEFVKEEEIAAPIDIVFETILEEIGPRNERGPGDPMPMKLEAWPGGRWFRDLGNGAGHWWGSVQSINPPSLLEICGPLFMSYPATSNLMYRLSEDNGVTRLKFTHRAMGYIAYDPQIHEHWHMVEQGWSGLLERIRKASVKK
ncbi:MAG: SRPBCC domain-containing protein [Acidobacteriaceae bacterium]|nr:SRPBCC domain-containing protein [Acidobacteriaceae bacterium]